MHELSLCMSIAELVNECAKRENFTRVSRVFIDIGSASAVDPESLQFCFPLTVKDTLAEDAELIINRIALKTRCSSCQTEYSPESIITTCPACGGQAAEIIQGREMRVVSFEGG